MRFIHLENSQLYVNLDLVATVETDREDADSTLCERIVFAAVDPNGMPLFVRVYDPRDRGTLANALLELCERGQ